MSDTKRAIELATAMDRDESVSVEETVALLREMAGEIERQAKALAGLPTTIAPGPKGSIYFEFDGIPWQAVTIDTDEMPVGLYLLATGLPGVNRFRGSYQSLSDAVGAVIEGSVKPEPSPINPDFAALSEREGC